MEIQGKIVLAGGGGAEDSQRLDEVFASWIGKQGRLLYLPIALRGMRPFESCFEWITRTFAPLSIGHIAMWTDLKDHRADELDEFDAVYIGGGNTFSLLADLIHSGFDRFLVSYAARGGIIYGGSAGAVVLGSDIRTVSHIDRNQIGLKDVNGLNLSSGHAIWPHYNPGDDALISAFVLEQNQPVLAIPERSGVILQSGRLSTVGFEPSFRFSIEGKSTIP